MDETNIILFPKFEKLKKEIENLQEQLTQIILERDNLRYIVCENIENKYLLVLGSLEYKVYKKMIQFLRMKRKLHLIQKAINHQEEANIKNIENLLDEEFTVYKEKLDIMMDNISSAIDWKNGEVLSEDDSKEIKKLYRIVVKKLHPDLNPKISEIQKEILMKAIKAYEGGDLVTMQIIAELVNENNDVSRFTRVDKEMLKEKNRLKSLIGVVKKSIKKIKSEYPYTLKDILDDEEEIERKKKELTNLLTHYENMIELYEMRMNVLSGNKVGGPDE